MVFGCLFVLIRALHFCACLLAFGLCVFDRMIAVPVASSGTSGLGTRWNRIVRRWLWISLAVALLTGFLWFLEVTVVMSGFSPFQALKPKVLAVVWNQTLFGWVWQWRLYCWAAAAIVARLLSWKRSEPQFHGWLLWPALLFTGLLTASLAWAGHGLIGSSWHRAADVLHLLAAACWPCGLLPFLLMLRATRVMPPLERQAYVWAMARRFSNMSVFCVALLLATGIINGFVLVGSFSALMASGYGLLLLAKIFLFCVVVIIGAVNRLSLNIPAANALSDSTPATDKLFRRLPVNVALELAFAGIIMLIVGLLGLLSPPVG